MGLHLPPLPVQSLASGFLDEKGLVHLKKEAIETKYLNSVYYIYGDTTLCNQIPVANYQPILLICGRYSQNFWVLPHFMTRNLSFI